MREGLALMLASMLPFATPAMAQQDSAPERSERPIPDAPKATTEGQVFQLDMLILDGATDPERLKALDDDDTLAAVASRLDSLGIAYERKEGSINTATLPPDLAQRVRALAPGQPFIVPYGNKLLICAVVGPAPNPPSAE